MTTDETIRELANIIAELIDVIKTVLPHNYQAYLKALQERAEELTEECNL